MIGIVFLCLVGWAAAECTTEAQKAAEQRLNDPKNDDYTFEDLLRSEKRAVAGAEAYFEKTCDDNHKQRVASILLSIGVRDDKYFNYLQQAASDGLANIESMPYPTIFDKQGKAKEVSPRFLQWCRKHRRDPHDTAEEVYYKWPIPFLHFAASGDPRAYGLLLRGLRSRSPLIRTIAAKGLAKINDPRAIEPIIIACQTSNPDAASAIAEALLYFNDPRAQEAAEKYITDPKALAEFRNDVQTKGVKGLFGY